MTNAKPPSAKGYGGARENIIISLGGSLVAPEAIDVAFLKAFKKTLQKYVDPEIKPKALNGASSKRFFIFVGGGKVCRNYQQALAEFGADSDERDWMGIEISRLNARIVKQLFGEQAFSEVVTDPTKKVSTSKGVIVAGGFKPGASTDYCAVTMAKSMGIKTIINLSNIDYVYDRDPRKFKNAKAFKEIAWEDFKKLVGGKWTPGLSSPFDPRASKEAEILKIKVAVINGKDLGRLDNFLKGKDFVGTTIS